MRVFKFILLMTKSYRLYIAGIMLAMFVVVLDSSLKPILIKQFVDISAGNLTGSLWHTFLWYTLLQIMLTAFWELSDYCHIKYNCRFRMNVAEYFMSEMYHHSYNFFQNQLSGSLTTKVNDALSNLPSIIFNLINPFGYFAVLLIISMFLMFSVSAIFAMIMISWVSLFLFFQILCLKKMVIFTREYAQEKSVVIGNISDYFTNISSVKSFAQKNFEINRFSRLKQNLIFANDKEGMNFIKIYTWQGIFTTIYILSIISLLIIKHEQGLVTSGDFALILLTNFNIIGLIFNISNNLKEFLIKWGAVDKALQLIEDTPEILDIPKASELKVTTGKIAFKQINFGYENSELIFKNLSIDIKGGEKIGLVGYSGSGKSSFVNLILRIYDVKSGQIFVDEQNIAEVKQDSLRQNIAMIPQDPNLFHRSLKENIEYGRPGATFEQIVAAAKRAHAHEFIVTLPNGYDALVGERGVKLSGGQRQRVAIARAILKDAPILILDEATSQLDSITETNIQESLSELMENKTTVVIAHRLSTLLRMDRILVFNAGQIVESGNHQQLLNQNGLYKTLWDAQVGGFLPDTPNKIE